MSSALVDRQGNVAKGTEIDKGTSPASTFQYYGFGQPAYLEPVLSNFVPVMNNIPCRRFNG